MKYLISSRLLLESYEKTCVVRAGCYTQAFSAMYCTRECTVSWGDEVSTGEGANLLLFIGETNFAAPVKRMRFTSDMYGRLRVLEASARTDHTPGHR
jgi:hypothetical protein